VRELGRAVLGVEEVGEVDAEAAARARELVRVRVRRRRAVLLEGADELAEARDGGRGGRRAALLAVDARVDELLLRVVDAALCGVGEAIGGAGGQRQAVRRGGEAVATASSV
jgi:hypothetical protein